jgi:hypothetical protein
VIALLIALPAIAAYLAGFVAIGRRTYARKRPFTEPLSCEMASRFHTHYSGCYRRPGTLVDSQGEALATALLYGFGWPLVLIGGVLMALGRLVLASSRPTPAEVEAKTSRLEREMDMDS